MTGRATFRQLTHLIDALPIYDLQDCELERWAKAFPATWEPEMIWYAVAEQIAAFACRNAITFFERPRLTIEEGKDLEKPLHERRKIVTAVIKHRKLTGADMKFRNQKTAGEISAKN